MKLILEISDEQLIQLDQVLRISRDDYERLRKGQGFSTEPAARILAARKLLDLNGCPTVEPMERNTGLHVVES